MVAARLNPFRRECVEALPFQFNPGWSWAHFDRAMIDHGCCGAVIGPHGSGKTTLVEEWVRRVKQHGRSTTLIRLNQTSTRAEKKSLLAAALRPPENSILIIDGAEQLNWWQWRRLRSTLPGDVGLLITAHRKGRLPTLYQTETTPTLLADLGDRLTDRQCAFDWRTLHREFSGNIREAFRHCYQQLAAPAGDPKS